MKRNVKKISRFWILTLIDLMLIILTFFVMLYAMSSPNQSVYKHQSSKEISLKSSLQRGIHLNYLEQILSQFLASFDDYQIRHLKNSIEITFPEYILKKSKQQRLSDTDRLHLQELAEIFSNISNEIILKIGGKNLKTQDALLFGTLIANELKKGGYKNNLKIIHQKDDDFAQIIILEQIRIEK